MFDSHVRLAPGPGNLSRHRCHRTLLVWLGMIVLAAPMLARGDDSPSSTQQTTFQLDNVTIALSGSFRPSSKVSAAAPGEMLQVATAVTLHPFQEISVTAVPFGARASSEDLPEAQPGGAEAYVSELSDFRTRQGATPQAGPVANIFGQQVAGLASVVNLKVDGPSSRPVLVVEWVVEAGLRLWIVRASQEQPETAGAEPSPTILDALADLTVTSDTLARPSTVGEAATVTAGPMNATGAGAHGPGATEGADLPVPSWWNGDCDSNRFTGSYRLGAVYRGMPACGPLNSYVATVGFPGVQQLEWQCAELSKRYLYLAYGCPAYSANGSQVVDNYPASCPPLQKIANGTASAAPQPGDVLSYGATTTAGHTSVVTSSSVDGSGNGSITVIEQNNSAGGQKTHTVTNWSVYSSLTVTKWLHGSSLVTADGSTVYWVQNGKKYHVASADILTAMQTAGVPGWSWSSIGTVTASRLAAWTTGPELVTTSCGVPQGTACPSDGLLLRQLGGTQVFLVEKGLRRWINSAEALNSFGGDWFPDVIDVAPAILAAPYVGGTGNAIYGVGEGEANASIKSAMKTAYNRNALDSRCLRPSGWLGWPGTSFSSCIGFPSGPVGTSSSGATSLTGRYQNGAAETGSNKGAVEYSSLGAYAVHGAIYSKYRDLGYTASALGFPTSDESWSGSLRRSNFEGGYITWDPATNQTVVTYSTPPTTPTLRVVAPNGGESWTAGSVHQVSWTASGLNSAGELQIFWSADAGQNWQWVATLAYGTGAYSWTVPAQATAAARIFVGSVVGGNWEVTDQSDQSFSITSGGGPGNDTTAGATLAGSLPYATTEDTWTATSQAGDPVHSCTGSADSNTVWFRYVASFSGLLRVSTASSDYDTVLSAYPGTSSAGSELACSDDVSGTVQSEITFSVTSGQSYLIEVSDYGTANGGTLMLNLARASTAGGDFNGDGKTDILWRDQSNGALVVWFMNGASYSSATGIATVDLSWLVAGTPDFNGDGKTDILWRNQSNGALVVWFMNGASYSSATGIATVDLSWQVAGTADFNGDGKTDVLWRHRSTGALVVWLMNGASYSSATGISTVDLSWQVAGTADFNSDGKADILWRNQSNGVVALWYMNGASYSSAIGISTVDLSWQIAGTADFNSDGKADILWRNQSNGTVAVWYMSGATYAGATGIATVAPNWLIAGPR